MEGSVIGLAAFDLVLRRFRAGMVGIAVDIEMARMDANDRAADAPGFRIPTHVVADPELVLHEYFRAAWCASSSGACRAYHAPEMFGRTSAVSVINPR